jgi:hypothetical protein
MIVIERARIIATLPDMTARMMDSIPIGGEAAVGVLQSRGQGKRLRRDGNKVNVIRHQAVAEHSGLVDIGAPL